MNVNDKTFFAKKIIGLYHKLNPESEGIMKPVSVHFSERQRIVPLQLSIVLFFAVGFSWRTCSN